MRTVRALPPVETGVTDGLAWARFAPEDGRASAGVVVLHGADSVKENHFDFARACAGGGLAALVFDLRGHGASEGPLDGRAIDDVARMADVLRERAGVDAIGLRGSSMGGYLALVSARAADAGALTAMLREHDEAAAARALGVPLLLLHAEGDEVVPVELSRALHAAAPASKLVVIPGGHHRSIQHDAELQGEAVRFLARALGGAQR